jgi:hypothetical protein
MNVALLDSLGPTSYIFLGLVLFFGSRLLRRRSSEAMSPVVDAAMGGDVQVRIRSKKVVSIKRDKRVSRNEPASPVRRAANCR